MKYLYNVMMNLHTLIYNLNQIVFKLHVILYLQEVRYNFIKSLSKKWGLRTNIRLFNFEVSGKNRRFVELVSFFRVDIFSPIFIAWNHLHFNAITKIVWGTDFNCAKWTISISNRVPKDVNFFVIRELPIVLMVLLHDEFPIFDFFMYLK